MTLMRRKTGYEPACAEQTPFIKSWSIKGSPMGFAKPHAGEAAPRSERPTKDQMPMTLTTRRATSLLIWIFIFSFAFVM